MQAKMLKIADLSLNIGQVDGLPKNPRFIRDEKYKSLVQSVRDYPEMLELREVIAYDSGKELVVIAGNMRMKACEEAGIKEVPVKVLPKETPVEKLKAYTIKDNIPYGEWSMDDLANQWELSELEELGFSVEDLGIASDYELPAENKSLDENAMSQTENECPSCGFKW